MARKQTAQEFFILGLYRLIFNKAHANLKKYSRSLYIMSFLLLVVNIISSILASRFEVQIIEFLQITSDVFEVYGDKLSLGFNVVEASLGVVGALLDFTPSD